MHEPRVGPLGVLLDSYFIAEFDTAELAAEWLLKTASIEGAHVLLEYRITTQYWHAYSNGWYELHVEY